MKTHQSLLKWKEDNPLSLLLGAPLGILISVLAYVIGSEVRFPLIFLLTIAIAGPLCGIVVFQNYAIRKERKRAQEQEPSQEVEVSRFSRSERVSRFAPVQNTLSIPALILVVVGPYLVIYMAEVLLNTIYVQSQTEGLSFVDCLQFVITHIWHHEASVKYLLSLYLGVTCMLVGMLVVSVIAMWQQKKFQRRR